LLAKKYRLPSYLIPQVLKKGKRVYSSGFNLVVCPSLAGKKSLRFVFIVSKKFDKRAVGRNKFKRRMREAVKLNLKNIKFGYDIAIMAGKLGGKNQKDQIKVEFKKALGKMGLLKEE